MKTLTQLEGMNYRALRLILRDLCGFQGLMWNEDVLVQAFKNKLRINPHYSGGYIVKEYEDNGSNTKQSVNSNTYVACCVVLILLLQEQE